jgi:hypothetical protein
VPRYNNRTTPHAQDEQQGTKVLQNFLQIVSATWRVMLPLPRSTLGQSNFTVVSNFQSHPICGDLPTGSAQLYGVEKLFQN